MRIIPRSEWGARDPRSISMGSSSRSFTVHWEGIPSQGRYTVEQEPELIRNIQNFHMDNRGWADIAYNFIVTRNGNVYEGRGWNVYNAANGTTEGNRTSECVCVLIGRESDGSNVDTLTAKAKDALVWLYKENRARGGSSEIWRHSDWVPTECPGEDLSIFVPTIPQLLDEVNDMFEDADRTLLRALSTQVNNLAAMHNLAHAPTLPGRPTPVNAWAAHLTIIEIVIRDLIPYMVERIMAAMPDNNTAINIPELTEELIRGLAAKLSS